MQHLPEIIISAAALLLIGFSQTAGDARAFATRHRYRIDVNQESIAQGMANLGAGVFQGMPVSTSLSASSLNESAGARTPVASLATGAFVIATLILLAPVFSDLPKAVLAAVIIDAVVFGMIDVAELRRLRRVKRFDFWIAIAALVGVLSAGVLLGVVIGDRPVARMAGLCRDESLHAAAGSRGRDAGVPRPRRAPRGRDAPEVAVLRIDGGLFFATAEAVDERVRAVTDGQPGLRTLVLDLEGVNFVDAQGAAKLTEIRGAHRRGRTHPAAGTRQAAGDGRARGGGVPRGDRPRPGARQCAPGREGPWCRGTDAARGLTSAGHTRCPSNLAGRPTRRTPRQGSGRDEPGGLSARRQPHPQRSEGSKAKALHRREVIASLVPHHR